MAADIVERASALDRLSADPLDCFDTADWNFEVALKWINA